MSVEFPLYPDGRTGTILSMNTSRGLEDLDLYIITQPALAELTLHSAGYEATATKTLLRTSFTADSVELKYYRPSVANAGIEMGPLDVGSVSGRAGVVAMLGQDTSTFNMIAKDNLAVQQAKIEIIADGAGGPQGTISVTPETPSTDTVQLRVQPSPTTAIGNVVELFYNGSLAVDDNWEFRNYGISTLKHTVTIGKDNAVDYALPIERPATSNRTLLASDTGVCDWYSFVAGTNVTIVTSEPGKTITISASVSGGGYDCSGPVPGWVKVVKDITFGILNSSPFIDVDYIDVYACNRVSTEETTSSADEPGPNYFSKKSIVLSTKEYATDLAVTGASALLTNQKHTIVAFSTTANVGNPIVVHTGTTC